MDQNNVTAMEERDRLNELHRKAKTIKAQSFLPFMVAALVAASVLFLVDDLTSYGIGIAIGIAMTIPFVTSSFDINALLSEEIRRLQFLSISLSNSLIHARNWPTKAEIAEEAQNNDNRS